MSDTAGEQPALEIGTLRGAIQEEYSEVASNPRKGFHLHTGRRSLGRLLALDGGTLVLVGHTSEPFPSDGEPVAAPLSEVRESITLLGKDEEALVRRITERAPPAPDSHERIAQLNRAGAQPEGDPTELEAGANRCAAG